MGTKTDYLAVIMIGSGGSWGRDPVRKKAIQRALKIYKEDWSGIYKIGRGHEVVVNVVDVYPHNEVSWDNGGFKVDDKKLDRKVEHIHHIF